MTKNWPAVRETNNHGVKVWEVDARHEEDGERKGERKHFPLTADGKAAAEGWRALQRAARLNATPSAFLQVVNLQQRVQSKPLHEAIELLLISKAKDDHVAEDRLYDTTIRLKKFMAFCGTTRSISDITPEDCTAFLRGFNAVTRNEGYRKELVMLWNFAFEKGWVAKPISKSVKLANVTPGEIHILSVEEADSLMRASLDPEMRSLNALVLFGGIRVEEVTGKKGKHPKPGLDWSRISFREAGHIDVPAAVAKTNERRLIEGLPENLRAWLLPVAKKSGPIVTRTLMHIQRDTWKRAGLHPWKQDSHRHSFISYFCKLFGLEKAADFGGTSERIIRKKYRQVVFKDDAERYFEIYPEGYSSEKIVPMPALESRNFPRQSEAI